MRTLKKTLCLVLALVMMLGLCAINATATSYTDDASIGADYREALEVLSAIGVFNGKDDGSLGPTDSLTRVQGCYLICKMLGAPNGAGFTSFSDVSAQDSPIVAYCQVLGIVNGYGDNTFGPYDPLTGAAFAKWCLVALGYNAEVEGMSGSGWMTGTQHLTTVVGLDDDIPGYDQSVNITREQAAKMCLNTLEATMVEYQDRIDITNTDGLNVNVAGRRNNLANNSGSDYRTSVVGPNDTRMVTMQFVEMYFPQLKQDDTANIPVEDDMYNPLKHVWNYRGNELYRTLDTPFVSYTGKTDRSTVSADLSSYYVVGNGGNKMYVNNATTYAANTATSNNRATGTYFQMNGIPTNTMFTYGNGNNSSQVTGGVLTFRAGTARTMAEIISDLTANGREVDFYATDDNEPNKITDVVITGYTVAKVRNVTVNGTTTNYTFAPAQTAATMDITNVYRTYGDAPADNTMVTDASLAKDDYVTITYPGEGATNAASKVYVYATEMFTGLQTSRSSNNTVVVDGSTYNVAAGVAKNAGYTGLLSTTGVTPDFENSNTTCNFFMDQFGYLVHSDAIANGNFAFIVGASGKTNNDVDGRTPEISVRAVLSDGTVGTYKVATEKKRISALNNNGGVLYADSAITPTMDGNYNRGNITAAGGDTTKEVYVIKNTDILVGSNDAIDVNGVNGKNWIENPQGNESSALPDADKDAKLLMGQAYGYVYNYTLNGVGDTITLSPVNKDGVTAYNNVAYTEGTVYAGQTTTAVISSSTSYGSKSGAGNYNVPSDAVGGGNTDHRLLVSANTPIIIYNSNNKTSTVVTGISNMPSLGTNSGAGYFAARANDSTNMATCSLTANVIFVTRGGGVVTSTKEYLFIDATTYQKADQSDNTSVWSYLAWHEDEAEGSLWVTDVDNEYLEENVGNMQWSGLYTINANNEVTAVALRDYGDVPTGHGPTPAQPYAYVNSIVTANNMVQVGSDWYYLDNVNRVYPYGYVSDDDATGAFIVLEVNNSDYTGYAKTIYYLN